MPLDESNYSARIDALEKIDHVIEQLPSEDRWCKHALYTADGRRCILGAMQAVHGGMLLKQPILQAIQEVTGRSYSAIEVFNDRHATDFAQVRTVLLRARQKIVDGTARYEPPVSRTSWFRRVLVRDH